MSAMGTCYEIAAARSSASFIDRIHHYQQTTLRAEDTLDTQTQCTLQREDAAPDLFGGAVVGLSGQGRLPARSRR